LARSFDVIVIGAGVNGVWSALDLALRGLSVAVIDKGSLASETSGKFHGLLHSGARYVVRDPAAAVESWHENQVLSRIASHAIEDTGGYFVAVTKSDEEYYDEFIKGLRKAGIPYHDVDVFEALKEEPELSKEVRRVVEVPDKVVYARDLMASVALAAYREGALLLEYMEAVEIKEDMDELRVRIHDKLKDSTLEFRARAVVNAAGPWAGEVARRAGVEDVDVLLTAGTIIVYNQRLTRHVINRMRPPSDGDILVPYGSVSLMGTTAFIVENPDELQVSEEDVEFLVKEGSVMVPRLARLPVKRAYVSIRPLIRVTSREGSGNVGREATRSFRIVAHEMPKGFFTIIGGKFVTGRLVGEKVGDIVAEYLGTSKKSSTNNIRLLETGDPYEELRVLTGANELVVKNIMSLKNGMDEERGRMAAYMFIQGFIAAESRKAIGA
jgi:glycerol-3-phosphate dehydrogenase